MMKVLLPAMLGVQLVMPVSDQPPRLNVEQGCRAIVRIDPTMGATFESCMRDEREAEADLKQKWPQFSVKDRELCLDETKIAGSPSYVDVLECLEISKSTDKGPNPQ